VSLAEDSVFAELAAVLPLVLSVPPLLPHPASSPAAIAAERATLQAIFVFFRIIISPL
jgi:hypothetical protein